MNHKPESRVGLWTYQIYAVIDAEQQLHHLLNEMLKDMLGSSYYTAAVDINHWAAAE